MHYLDAGSWLNTISPVVHFSIWKNPERCKHPATHGQCWNREWHRFPHRLVNYSHFEPGPSQVFHLAKNPPSFQISVDRLKIPIKHLVILRGKQKSLIDSHLPSLYYHHYRIISSNYIQLCHHYRIASAIIILSSSSIESIVSIIWPPGSQHNASSRRSVLGPRMMRKAFWGLSISSRTSTRSLGSAKDSILDGPGRP